MMRKNAKKTKEDHKAEADATLREIEKYSRGPFRRILSDLVEATPELDELRKFAKKAPDRHAQSMAIVGRLAGYSEKLSIDHNLTGQIDQLSDMQLVAKYEKLKNELKAEIRRESAAEIVEDVKLIDVTPDKD